MEKNSHSGSNSRGGALNRHWFIMMRLVFTAAVITAIAQTLAACRPAEEPPVAAPVATIAPSSPSPTATRPTIRKKSAMRLPRLEAEMKKAVAARLKSWESSIETRDLEKNIYHYAEQIETYYLATNASRDVVRADRERAFKRFHDLKLDIINVDINLESSEAAIITFDKSWDFTNDTAFSNGLVQQEIQMRKIEKQWLIVSEKDLQVYRYQNQ